MVIVGLKKAVFALFFMIILFLTVSCMFYTTGWTVIAYEDLFIADSPVINLLCLVVFIFLLFKSQHYFSKFTFTEYKYNKIKFYTLFAMLVFLLLFVILGCLEPVLDQIAVVKVAEYLHDGSIESFVNENGYARGYHNNHGIILLLYLFFFVVGGGNYLAFQIVNAFVLILLYNEFSKIEIEKFKQSNILKLCLFFSLILCLPLIYFVPYVYGNLLGMLFSLAAINVAIRFSKYIKYKDGILMFIFSYFAILSKSNYIIFIIGIFIYIFAKTVTKYNIKMLLSTIMLAIIVCFSQYSATKALEIVIDHKIDKGVSSWGWISMGLQDNGKFPGWWNNVGYGNSIETFKNNGSDHDAHAKVAKQMVKERLSEFSADKKYALDFFVRKEISQWCSGELGMWILMSSKYNLYEPPKIIKYFTSVKGVQMNAKFINIYEFIIYFGVLLFLLLNRDTNDEITLLYIIVIGGFVFHTFWEAKDTYIFSYFLLLIPMSVMGYYSLCCVMSLKSNGHCVDIKNI